MQASTTHVTISPQDLMVLGLNQIAYIRPVVENGQHLFAVHAADGTRLGILPTRDMAVGALLQHDLEPVALH
jgi:hypothetical protein